MDIKPNKNLFWFLKDSARFDLNNPSTLDAYVQQVISRGKTSDVKDLLKTIDLSAFQESFSRISRFVPHNVKKFWEDLIGSFESASKRTFR